MALKDYLKKCIKEMPLGVAKEILGTFKAHYLNRMCDPTASQEQLIDYAGCLGYVRKMIHDADHAIAKIGTEPRLGDVSASVADELAEKIMVILEGRIGKSECCPPANKWEWEAPTN